MLRISFSKEAMKFLKSLPIKHQKQIVENIDFCATNPHYDKIYNLVGLEPLKYIKSGEYRIILHFEADCLEVKMIGKRNDSAIYKEIKRK